MTPLLLLSIFSPLVPLVTGFRRKNSLLWVYPLVAFFFDLLGSFLKRGLHVDNGWAANLFMLTEFILLSFLFKDRIFRNSTVLFYLFLTGLSLFFIGYTLTHSVWKFNMLACCPFLLMYLCYGIAGLYALLQKQETTHVERSWFFWFNVAVLVYAAGAFLIYLFKDYLIRIDEEKYMGLWSNVYLLVNITKNILLGVALYHFRKPLMHEQPV